MHEARKGKSGRGERLFDAFDELPERDELPEYYRVIKRPLSMEEIKGRIERFHYKTDASLLKDFKDMCANAKYFNEEGSMIWEDAVSLEKFIEENKNE